MSLNSRRNTNQTGQSQPKPKPVAEWTVMVYLAGDNNLSAECVWSLTEMQKGMSSDKINVIAQFDPNDGLARTRRYEITKEGVLPRPNQKDKKWEVDDEPKKLDLFAKDFASWNAGTGEVHFGLESRKANKLARQRHKEIKAQRRRAIELSDQGQALNASLRPDDSSAPRNDTDAASPVTLYNFLSFGLEFYPARHYMIVLSGHSAGVEPSYLLRDDSSGSYMSFRQLKVVFKQLHNDLAKSRYGDDRASKIDILGFDTCLMSMAEICSELQGCVDIVVGSETYTPSSGWPYQSILEDLSNSMETADASKPTPLSPDELAIKVVAKYFEFYKDYVTAGVSVALSALDVRKVKWLAPHVKTLAVLLKNELIAEHPELDGKPEKKLRPFTDALILAHWEAQSYNGEWYVDLIDFCECLMRRYPKQSIREACEGLIGFLKGGGDDNKKDKFVIASQVSGPAYQYSNGVAIYFPWASVARYFWDFDFATRSCWGDFLAYYTNFTRRKFRVPAKPNSAEKEMIQKLEQNGGNFLNYDRLAGKGGSHKGPDLVFNKMASDKMASDKMASDKMASDKMASDKMASDKSGNPIHSMRNPPFVSLDFDF
jgi:hypothetical protein